MVLAFYTKTDNSIEMKTENTFAKKKYNQTFRMKTQRATVICVCDGILWLLCFISFQDDCFIISRVNERGFFIVFLRTRSLALIHRLKACEFSLHFLWSLHFFNFVVLPRVVNYARLIHQASSSVATSSTRYSSVSFTRADPEFFPGPMTSPDHAR